MKKIWLKIKRHLSLIIACLLSFGMILGLWLYSRETKPINTLSASADGVKSPAVNYFATSDIDELEYALFVDTVGGFSFAPLGFGLRAIVGYCFEIPDGDYVLSFDWRVIGDNNLFFQIEIYNDYDICEYSTIDISSSMNGRCEIVLPTHATCGDDFPYLQLYFYLSSNYSSDDISPCLGMLCLDNVSLSTSSAFVYNSTDLYNSSLYDIGYDEGYWIGREDGEFKGYSEGYELGYNQGCIDGGVISGYDEGYSKGYTDGRDYGETIGYDNGYDEGYDLGLSTGKYQGYEEGFNAGQSEDPYGLDNLIFTIIDAPFRVIREALNFEIFGFNVSSLVLFILTGVVVLFVVKTLRG